MAATDLDEAAKLAAYSRLPRMSARPKLLDMFMVAVYPFWINPAAIAGLRPDEEEGGTFIMLVSGKELKIEKDIDDVANGILDARWENAQQFILNPNPELDDDWLHGPPDET